MPRRTRRQASNEEDHETQSRHRNGDHHENDLHQFDPARTEIEHLVEHDDGQRSAAVHCEAENTDTNQTHNGRD